MFKFESNSYFEKGAKMPATYVYFVHLKRYETQHDTPAIGCWHEYVSYQEKFGPYKTREAANKALVKIKEQKESRWCDNRYSIEKVRVIG